MFWTVILIINAVIGVILFEYAWGATKRHRQVDEERDKRYPAFRRLDVPKWNKILMYPAAATVLVPRCLLFIGGTALHVILHKILFFGTDLSQPLPSFKRAISKRIN